MKWERFLDDCDNEFSNTEPIGNPAACLSCSIPSSKFLAIQWVGHVGGRTRQDPRVVDMIKIWITTMLLIISMLSFLYTKLQFICYTSIHISCSHCWNFFVFVIHSIFKLWREGATFLLLLHFLPVPGEADELSMTRSSMMISPLYLTITMLVKKTFQDLIMSLLGDYCGNQWARGHQTMSSSQHQ